MMITMSSLSPLHEERGRIRAALAAVDDLHARVRVLTWLAIGAASRDDTSETADGAITDPRWTHSRVRDVINTPIASEDTVGRVHACVNPHRRVIGEPFFVSRDGQTPHADDEAAARQRTSNHLKSWIRAEAMKWNAKLDAALAQAVGRVAQSAVFAEALAPYGLDVPAHARPLGEASDPTLVDIGLRAESQYRSVPFNSLITAGMVDAMPAAQQQALKKDLALAWKELPERIARRVTPLACEELDWVRIAHGGWFPPKSAASPFDCKVRWASHGCTHWQFVEHAAEGWRLASIDAADGAWTSAEDAALIAAAGTLRAGGWLELVARCRLNRSPAACFKRYRELHGEAKPRSYVAEWTPEEDALLRELVSDRGTGSWADICDELPRPRTAAQAMHRYSQLRAAEITAELGESREWTVEEDVRLRVVHRMFSGDWSRMTEFMPGRTASALYERWTNVLMEEDDRV